MTQATPETNRWLDVYYGAWFIGALALVAWGATYIEQDPTESLPNHVVRMVAGTALIYGLTLPLVYAAATGLHWLWKALRS